MIRNTTAGIACALPLLAASLDANAQSAITLYGVIDTSIQYAHSGSQNTTRVDSSNVMPSVWGLTGREDLGGGMSAIFKLESGFNANTGADAQATKMFGREAWVGLQGRFGTVKLGENNTPMAWALMRYSMGDLGHWNWGHASNDYDFFISTRVSNSIYYTSPRIAGVQWSAMYARGANGDPTLPRTLGDTLASGLNYTHGPLSIEADYESEVYALASTATAATPTRAGNYTFVGASWDFSVVKVGALVMFHRGASGVPAVNSGVYADPDNTYYDVSALIPHLFSPHGSLMLSFGQYRLQSTSAGDSSSLGLRYDYRLSARTGVYAGVANIWNGSLASFSQTGASYTGIPVQTGKNQFAALVGMMHRF